LASKYFGQYKSVIADDNAKIRHREKGNLVFKNRSSFLVLVLVLPFLCGCGEPQLHVMSGKTMGTTYTVKVVGDYFGENGLSEEILGSRIDAELVRLNGLMSTYDETSELSRFNQAAISESFPVSGELLEVLQISRMIYEQSNGAFDVTVGPLVNLWGFGPAPSQDIVPSDEAILTAMDRTGFDLLKVGNGTLGKEADVYVDLSAIAKGYAVDRLSKILEAEKITNYLVEVGGELRAKGRNDRNTPWTVAIEKPDSLSRSVFRIIELKTMSMATSGDYRNFFESNGNRYSHTIDPRTGWPIRHPVASVTVIAPTAVLADGYATAIDVLGLEEGLQLAEAQNLAVLVIIKTEDGFEERSSSALDAYMDASKNESAKISPVNAINTADET
jgi:thiamine biosynthesis lipoprotein